MHMTMRRGLPHDFFDVMGMHPPMGVGPGLASLLSSAGTAYAPTNRDCRDRQVQTGAP